MNDADSQADPFGEIADRFVQEFRRGEAPSVEEYAQRFPECADEIREILPALVLMEKVKTYDSEIDEDGTLPASEESMVGSELGDYRILREIGRGGMGIVYEAEQVSLSRRVALKILPRNLLTDSKQHLRFAREAKSAGRLHHTNIVPVFGIGDEDGLHYYVMQFINGRGLDDVLDELKRIHGDKTDSAEFNHRAGTVVATGRLARSLVKENSASEDSGVAANLSSSSHHSDASSNSLVARRAEDYWASVARIGIQVGQALHYAHEQGVTHRDIKPSNLLLDIRGSVWVTDFGLAKADDQQNLTISGDILGTIRYMPPEAFDGESDARSDLYSLGITLYELTAFQPAFAESNRRRLIKKVTACEIAPLSKAAPGVPRDLATIIEKLVQRNPEDRYADAQALVEDLQRFLRDAPILARRISPWERLARWSRHNKALAASFASIVILLLVLSIGGIVSAAYFRRQEEVQRGLVKESTSLATKNQKLVIDAQHSLAASLQKGQELEIAWKRAEQQEKDTRRNLYFAHMRMAHQAIREHRGLLRTRMLLDRCRPMLKQTDLRGWEWFYLQSLCRQEEFALAGHSGVVRGIGWSKNGKSIASTGLDGTLLIWNVAARRVEKTVQPAVKQAYALAWSPDEKWLAVGGQRGLKVYGRDLDRPVRAFAKTRSVYGIAWSPDESKLAFALKETSRLPGQTVVVRTSDWSVAAQLPTPKISVYATGMSWNQAGTVLATPAENEVTFWKVGDNKKATVPYFRLKDHKRAVQAVAFHPTLPHLFASGSRDSLVNVYHLRSLEENSPRPELISRLSGHTHGIAALEWHPRLPTLASSSWDGTTRIWDVEKGTQIRSLIGHYRHAFALAWSPQGDAIATAGDDDLIKIWRPESHHEKKTFTVTKGLIKDLDISPDGSLLCVGSGDGELVLWDLGQNKKVREFKTSDDPIRDLAFHPKGRKIVSTGSKDVTIWSVGTNQPQGNVRLHAAARCAAWSPTGDRLAVGGLDPVLSIWDAEIRSKGLTLRRPNSTVTAIAWHPNGTQLAFGQADGSVGLFDTESGETRGLGNAGRYTYGLVWDAAGRMLATTRGDRVVRVIDTQTGKVVTSFEGHNDVLPSLAWGPNDRRIVSADARGTLKLWDTQTGEETLSLFTGVGELRAVRWHHPTHSIVANTDGHVVIWNASRGYEQSE